MRLLAAILYFVVRTSASGQPLIAEVLAGDKNYWYQHSISRALPGDTRFGVFHTSSLHFLYNDAAKDELMSQTYLTYRLTTGMKLAVGTFYASKPGLSPSMAMQFSFRKNYLRGLFVPRLDLKNNGSVEGMTLLEYIPPINERINFYSRLQMMSNYGPGGHNRSYQNIRFGIQFNTSVLGVALNVDERGPEAETQHNWGVFLRAEI